LERVLHLSLDVAFCARQNFSGCARWLRLQSTEEYGHAMKLYTPDRRDGTVELKAMPEPKHTTIRSARCRNALSREQEVSQQIDLLLRAELQGAGVRRHRGAAVVPDGEVEEEKSRGKSSRNFRLVGNDPASLLDLDATGRGRWRPRPW